jgi:nucleotide-binding universal stress UspA family protein
MGKYRKILVATDGSESSLHALKESLKLATNEKSWITVLSVIPPYRGDLELVGVGNVLTSIRKPCDDALEEAKRIAEAEGVLIRPTCEDGEAFERIVDLAEAENCDLIVMGRRGLHRLERALVGSVTARVIGYSQKDVLIVPKGSSVGWTKILFTTDGSKYSRAAAEKAIDFARSYGGELKILSVVDVPSEFYGEAPQIVDDLIAMAHRYTEEARDRAAASGVRTETFVREGEAYEAIIRTAREQQVNTIVMGSHGRTGLRRLLMGSVAEKVIGHAPCPVLIVKT